MGSAPGIDWHEWLDRWDRQQEGYVPDREARFTAMFDAVDALLPPTFTALDLGCGPGSLSARLLDRFPRARVHAIDFDPAMLAVGRGALGDRGGRLHWADADLADPDWAGCIAGVRVDAVLSSTALHWLEPDRLTGLYAEIGALLPSGGLLLDADDLGYGAGHPVAGALADRRLDRLWADESFSERGIETAEQWWERLSAEPGMAELLAERAARYARKTRPGRRADHGDHVAALRAAGFAEVATIWQNLAGTVLMAVR